MINDKDVQANESADVTAELTLEIKRVRRVRTGVVAGPQVDVNPDLTGFTCKTSSAFRV